MQRLAEAGGPALEVMPDHHRSEAWAILSEKIARLPETYRAPVVLCYLEAMSYQAAAPTKRSCTRAVQCTRPKPAAATTALEVLELRRSGEHGVDVVRQRAGLLRGR